MKVDNHGRRDRAWLYEITVGIGGFVLLAAATATGSAITPDQLPLAAFLLVLSFLVKRLGFRVTPRSPTASAARPTSPPC